MLFFKCTKRMCVCFTGCPFKETRASQVSGRSSMTCLTKANASSTTARYWSASSFFEEVVCLHPDEMPLALYFSYSGVLPAPREGDMGICGVDVFLMRWCGEKNLNLRCCGDLKPYGVRCLCFLRCGVRWNEITCGAGVSCLTFSKPRFGLSLVCRLR